MKLGPCCGCERDDKSVRNIVMIARPAPVPGTGWGCVVCNLPMNGAIAVMCDDCMDTGIEPTFVCDGFPEKRGRARFDQCAPDVFEHDRSVDHEAT